jgi:hypothetical protein
LESALACDIFLSYTRLKDFRGTVADFAAHLQRELQKKTGRTDLLIFIDTKYIVPGAKWSPVLDKELASVRMLLVLLSPTWIRSPWCRQEYSRFIGQSQELRIDRQVVPIIWDDVTQDDCETDDQRLLLSEVLEHQAVPWGELQYETWASEGLRKAIGQLAVRLKPHLK